MINVEERLTALEELVKTYQELNGINERTIQLQKDIIASLRTTNYEYITDINEARIDKIHLKKEIARLTKNLEEVHEAYNKLRKETEQLIKEKMSESVEVSHPEKPRWQFWK